MSKITANKKASSTSIDWVDAATHIPEKMVGSEEYPCSERLIVWYDRRYWWGVYYHNSGNWSIENIWSNEPIIPDYFAYLNSPSQL